MTSQKTAAEETNYLQSVIVHWFVQTLRKVRKMKLHVTSILLSPLKARLHVQGKSDARPTRVLITLCNIYTCNVKLCPSSDKFPVSH